MSVSSSQLGNNLIDGRTHVSTSFQKTRDTKMETSHSHETSFVENFLFPLINEINRAVPPFSIVKIFEYFFFALQIYFLGQFYFLQEIFPVSALKIINLILFFGFSSAEEFTASIIVLISFNVLTAFFILFAAVLYRNTHETPKILLLIIRIWDGSLYNLTMIPNALFVATSFLLLGRDYSALNVLYCIFSIVCIFFSLYHNFAINLLLNRSPYLQSPFIQIWRPKSYYQMVMIYSFVAGFGLYLRDSLVSLHIIPSFLYILLAFFNIHQFLYDNFASIIFNSIFFSIPIGGSISALLFIIQVISNDLISSFIFYFVPFAVFVVVVVLVFFFISYRRQKIKKLLKYPHERMNDSEKQEYLATLGIKTPNQVYQFLQIGLENASDLFLDWALHAYIEKSFHNNPSVLMVLVWYVAFFPSKFHLMQDFITEINKIVSLSNYDKALFLQLHRVHIFRQSSTNKESSSDYKRLKSLTNRLMAQYSNFWFSILNASNNTEEEANANHAIYDKMNHDKDVLNNDVFYQKITMLRLEADSLWAEALGKYPNNARLVQEYSRYLLSARCRYKRGLKWKAKEGALTKGIKFENDQIFYHFALAYPMYIKKNIVDINGAFVVSSAVKFQDHSTSSMSSISSSDESSTSESDDDDDDSYSISSDLLEIEPIKPEIQLNLALERSVNVLKSANVSRVRVAAIVRFIFTLIYLFTCFGIVLSLFNEKDRFIDCFQYYATSTHYLELASQQIVWFWAQSYHPHVMSSSALSENIGPAFYKYFDQYESNLTRYIYNMSSKALGLYSQMDFEMYKERFSSSKELVNLTKFLSNKTIDHNVCFLQKTYDENLFDVVFYFETKTIPNSITVDFLVRLSLLNLMNLSLFDSNERRSWSNEQDFCNYAYQHWDVYNEMNGLIQNINPIYNTVMTEYEENNFSSPYLFNIDDIDNETTPKKYTKASDDLDRNDLNSNLDFNTNVFITFTPIVCLLLLFPIIIFLTYGIHHEWQHYTNLLRKFTRTTLKEEKKGQLIKDRDIKILLQEDSTHISFPVWLPNFISTFLIIAVLFLLILLSRENVQEITHTISQYMLFTQIQNTIFQMATDVVFLLFINDITKEDADPIYITTDLSKYLSVSNFTENLDREIDILTITYNLLSYGGPTLPGLIGQSSPISDFLLEMKCTPNYNSIFTSDYYSCISFHSLIAYFVKIVKMIYKSPGQYSLHNSIVYNIAFLTRTRFSDGFNEIVNLYESIYTDKVHTFMILAIVLSIVAVVACFVAFVFDFRSIYRIQNSMETLKDLILHIDPIDFVNNNDMVSLIYGKSRKINKKVTSATHAIFVTTDYGMIFINKDKTIETLNEGALSVFGFTIEQMLGQQLSFFIPEEDEENHLFYKVITSMIDGQSPLIYNGQVIGLKDNDIKVSLQITLLGFSSSSDYANLNHANSKFAESFGLMFKDQTDDLVLIESLDKIRKRSESFLMQMFPSQIMSQVIKGEQDVSFTSKCASVAFIDVESFSTYFDFSVTNPVQVLDELKAIVNAFDNKLQKFFRLTKVKIIGDCYVVASGLFTNDGMDQLNATQLLAFALECINCIDEMKIINHQVRIGIDSGGPIIAGLIGKVSPVFDIFGGVVNNARLLQQNSTPGYARISQATYDLSADCFFDFSATDDIVGINNEILKTFLVTMAIKSNASTEALPEFPDIMNEPVVSPEQVENEDAKMDVQPDM